MQVCDNCDSLSCVGVEHLRAYRVPDVYDVLCRDCARELNTHSAERMSDLELIAAIVDDSIGYATPRHASQHVEAFREGESDVFCERGVSCFSHDHDGRGGSLEALIESARRHWCILEQGNPEKAEDLAVKIGQWMDVEDQGFVASMGVSMAYPVGGI